MDDITKAVNDHAGADSVLNARLDSDGRSATYLPGDRVIVLPVKLEATVVTQVLHHDCGETFWGNIEVVFDDGTKGTCNGWQAKKL